MGIHWLDLALHAFHCEDDPDATRWIVCAIKANPTTKKVAGDGHSITAAQAQSLKDDAGTSSFATTASGIVEFYDDLSDDAKEAFENNCAAA